MRRLVVYLLPKNMGPGESEGRRAARARALLLQHQNDEGAVYVDVAKVKNKDAYVAAAVAATTGKIVTSCSVRTRSASQAEEMAIALAARSPGVRTILSDSKTAIRSFSRGATTDVVYESACFHKRHQTPGETRRLYTSWRKNATSENPSSASSETGSLLACGTKKLSEALRMNPKLYLATALAMARLKETVQQQQAELRHFKEVCDSTQSNPCEEVNVEAVGHRTKP
ncbi:hypothetical protein MRX96_052778 [Rhipicephalus microplus]